MPPSRASVMTMKNSSCASSSSAFLGGFDGARGVALVLQHGLKRQAHVFLVVHDEDGWQGRAHLGSFINVFAGKIRVNFAPFPSSDSTRTVPP